MAFSVYFLVSNRSKKGFLIDFIWDWNLLKKTMEVINNIIEVTELFGTIFLFHNFVKDFHERHNTSSVEAYLNSLGNLFGEGGDYH